jgi:hypothetical protein
MNLSLDRLIHVLNPVLRGRANYYRHAASSRRFAYLSHFLWWRTIRWLRRKHSRLTWKQIRRRYLGTQLDRPQRREARLARRGLGDPVSLPRPPHSLAVGGDRNRTNHHSTGSRRCLSSEQQRQSHVLWRAGRAGTCTSGSEGGAGKRTGGNAGTAPRPDPAR